MIFQPCQPCHPGLLVLLFAALLLGGCEKPEKAIDQLALARFYLEQNNDQQALDLLAAEIAGGRNLAEAHRLVGEIFLATGSTAEAVRHFSLAIEQGCAATCQGGLIDAYIGEGEGELATATLAATEVDEDDPRSRYQRIMIDHLGGASHRQTIARLRQLDTARARDRVMMLMLEQQRYPEIVAARDEQAEYSETQLLGLAAAYYALGDFEQAQELLLQARRQSPGKLITRNKILAVEMLVRVNIALNKINDAEQIYQAFLDNYQHSGYVAVKNSLAHLENQRYDQAIGEIRELAQYNPDSPEIARLLASASAGMRNHQGVVNAIGRFAGDLDDASRLLLANAFLQLGRPQDAIDLYADAQPRGPAQILLAEARLARGDRAGALATLRDIDIPTVNAERKRLADLWFALELYPAIIERFGPLEDSTPAVRHVVLRAYLAEGRVDAARAWAERQADVVLAAELLAMIELDRGNDDRAIEIYRDILRDHPNKRHRIMLAMTQLRRQDHAAALQQLRAALTMPGDNRVTLNLALRLLEETADPAVFDWLDSIEPEHRDYRTVQLLLANHETLQGRYEQARQRLEPFANDSDPFVYRLRARALSAEDPQGAWQLMERSLAAGFSLDTATRLSRYYLQQRDRENLARVVEQIENLAGVNIRSAKPLAAAYLFLERYPDALALADNLVRQGYVTGGRELRADTLVRQGLHGQAAGIYRELYRAAGSEPLLVKAYTARVAADAADRTAVLDEAELVLDRQKDWNALRYFAAMQYVDRDNRRADRHFRLLAERFPEDAVLLNNLAWANLDQDPPAALKFAGIARELDRDNDDFLDTYARALRNTGDVDGARQLLARRLDSGPDNSVLRDLLQSLN